VHANEPDLESHTRLTWDDGLEQLKAFKVKFGHVDIPTFYTDQQNQPLRFFVKNIRKSYKNIQEGQTSENKQLSDQRISERFDWRVVMKVQVPDQVSVNADQGR